MSHAGHDTAISSPESDLNLPPLRDDESIPPATTPEADAPAPDRGRTARIGVALAVAVLAVYGQTVFSDFGFVNADDPDYVTANPHVYTGLSLENARWAFTSFEAYNWHPLTWLSLQLDAQLFGVNPRGYHFTNVLLHLANTLLLFVVLQRMTGATWRSAAVAAFFALHPAHVESVAWIPERKDVLSTLFWLLAMLAYTRYAERPSIGRYLLVALATALGLLAKQMLVTLPAVLLLLDYWPLRRWQRVEPVPTPFARASLRWLILEKVPLILLALATIPLTMQAQAGVVRSLDQFPLQVRVANALAAYLEYLRMLVWPSGLTIFYPHPFDRLPAWKPIAASVLLLAATVVALGLARRRPYLPVGWLWFVGTLVPVIGFLQVGMQAYADRYTYVPWIGLFVCVAWGVADLAEAWNIGRRPMAVAGAAALAACLYLTWTQVGYWHDSEALWRHALKVTRNNWVGHEYLGMALADQGRLEEARDEYLEAVRLVPTSDSANRKLALVLEDLGELDEAAQYFNRSLRRAPQSPAALLGLGRVLERQRRFEVALKPYWAALEVNPGLLDARLGIGRCLTGLGDFAGARREYEAALQAHPNSADVYMHLGWLSRREGQPAAAIEQNDRAIALNPKSDEAYNEKGLALEALGRFDDAAASYRKAVDLVPKEFRYRCNLAYALFQAGQTEPAMKQYADASRLKRDWPQLAAEEAWVMATHADAKVRNGVQAVRLARQAAQATEYQQPRVLDVLAAACAETGRFDDAVKWEQQALDLLPGTAPPTVADELRERLVLYRHRQPFRTPASPRLSPTSP
ncbi:MAG: tetratricopeptide repeat protein [Gemmataceae bacterium]